MVAILLLDVADVLGERVGVDDVRRLDAVQDHVHDADDVGETFLFLAVEGLFLKRLAGAWREIAPWAAGIRNTSQRKPPEPQAPS